MYQRGIINILIIIVGVVLAAILVGIFTASSTPADTTTVRTN